MAAHFREQGELQASTMAGPFLYAMPDHGRTVAVPCLHTCGQQVHDCQWQARVHDLEAELKR